MWGKEVEVWGKEVEVRGREVEVWGKEVEVQVKESMADYCVRSQNTLQKQSHGMTW